jgi:hypothetical protein
VDDWMIDGGRALAVGLMIGGYIVIADRRKKRKLAGAGDQQARDQLEKSRTVDTVVAPVLLAAGVGLMIVTTYADYVRLRTPLSPDKAFQRAAESLDKAIKRYPKSFQE